MTTIAHAQDMIGRPSFAEVCGVFARIGFLSFGGPAAQIGLMHRVLVEEKRWLSETRFLHALNYCMLLPGPEAQQLATYTGWLLYGTRGGIVAGTLFFLPGLFVMVALSVAYALFQDAGWLSGLFVGLKAAILAVVAQAVVRLARKALKTRLQIAVAVLAFVALFFFDAPFPLVVIAAGLFGYCLAGKQGAEAPATDEEPEWAMHGAVISRPKILQSLGSLLVWLAVWQAPLVLVQLLGGPEILADLHGFFSHMALITFGGAYAVLAYVAQVAVETHGWLKPGEMLDGLALAETTPGPLVLVLSHVGFLAAFRNAAGLDPLLAGVLGAGITAWATFVPSFIWIFAGAPYMERLRTNRLLAAALGAITAAVVGVILNLSVWFGLHVLFAEVGRVVLWQGSGLKPVASMAWPDIATIDPAALLLAALAATVIFALRQSVGRTLLLCALCGFVYSLMF